MSDNLQMTIYNATFYLLNGDICSLRSNTDDKLLFVQVMALCQTGYKLLPDPMITKFTETYLCLMDSVFWKV